MFFPVVARSVMPDPPLGIVQMRPVQ
jgi:hypothetical protein